MECLKVVISHFLSIFRPKPCGVDVTYNTTQYILNFPYTTWYTHYISLLYGYFDIYHVVCVKDIIYEYFSHNSNYSPIPHGIDISRK